MGFLGGGGASSLNDLSDVTIGTPISNTDTTLRVLGDANTDGIYTVFDWTPPTGGGGEANNGLNLGTGVQVFETKVGLNLQFRTFKDSSEIDFTQNPSEIVASLIANAISNSKLAQVATQTIKGRATAATGNVEDLSAAQVRTLLNVEDGAQANTSESFIVAIGDETTTATVGTAKVTFRMPYALTLTGVRASAVTAPTGSVATFDINQNGTSVLSTKLTIDAGEKTSQTAATPPVISTSSLTDDAEITLDIDTVGSTVAGAGYKITLIGTR